MANVISSVTVAAPAPAVQPAAPASAAHVPSIPVAAVTPPAPVPAAAAGGNPTPSGGQSLPVATAATAPAAQGDLIQLQAVIAGVNQFLRDRARQMVFEYDPHSGKESVTIVNPATGEVIRQIPATQVLSTAQSLQQAGILMPGLFLNETA